MEYITRLSDFEGPLAVLLQLINKAKLSIEDVSLSEVTAQFMDHIEHMQELDMEVASEFLVIAATLMYIKSCKLLPDTKALHIQPEENPEGELKIKLLEYNKIKQAASMLEEQALLNSTAYYRTQMITHTVDPVLLSASGLDSKKLSDAIFRIANKVRKIPKEPVVHTVQMDAKTLKTRLNELKLFFGKYKQASFSELYHRSSKRFDIVLTFIAILKMASDGMLELIQASSFEDVIIRRKESRWAKTK